MTTTGNDQSAAVRCGRHGRNIGGVFFVPEPGEYVAAGYVCLHCWIAAARPHQLTRDEFQKLLGGDQRQKEKIS